MTDEMRVKPSLSSSMLKNYKNKLVSAEKAVSVIKSGDNIAIHSNCAFPRTLIEALVERKDELRDVQLIHALSVGELPYL